jgi:hypothetical protein
MVRFLIPPIGEHPPAHCLSPAAALARLSEPGCGGAFTVAFSREPAALRQCVPVLSAVAAAGARAAYEFPPRAPDETPLAHAARLVGLMFEQGAPLFPLRELRLAPAKAAKTHVNHRAELYLWISANGVDWPRHQPLWRGGRDGGAQAAEVTEGSSTFLSLLAIFGPAVAAGLAVPCEERAALPAAGAEPDPER